MEKRIIVVLATIFLPYVELRLVQKNIKRYASIINPVKSPLPLFLCGKMRYIMSPCIGIFLNYAR